MLSPAFVSFFFSFSFLKQLCSTPETADSEEMQEFLALNTDARIAFVKKPFVVSRIDKVPREPGYHLLGAVLGTPDSHQKQLLTQCTQYVHNIDAFLE